MELTPPDPRIGQLLQERYRILSRVAAGAMGVVYLGERVELGRQVAVKFLHPWIAAHKAFRSRFENEARAMSRLSHPGCVSVIDFGVDGASPYLVMDFVTGITLRQILERERLVPARAVSIARQLLAGLSHAHAQGIIHRDLKPENLILSDTAGMEDHLRILDFGLAKLRDGPAMTAGMAVGTPSYMSPEQTGGPGDIDGRTDIYSVGVLLFEMLVGKKPFVAEKVAEVLLMHRDAPPPLLRQVAPAMGFSAALEQVVCRAMAKLTEDRFQTAAEFGAALDRVPEAAGTARPAGGFGGQKPADAAPRRAPNGGAGDGGGGEAEATIADAGPPSWDSGPSGRAEPGAKPRAPGSSRWWRRSGEARSGEVQRWIALGGGAALAVVLVVIGVTRGPRQSGAPAPATAPARTAPAGAPRLPSSGLPASAAAPAATGETGRAAAQGTAARLADAERLAGAGEWEQAAVALEKARREDPQNAAAAYALANLYLERGRYLEGTQAARAAAQRDGRYRGDERLVKNLVSSLASDKTFERSQEVLRGFGSAATPYLRDAAAEHKNPKVRQRAADLLESRGKNAARSRSSSGSSSFFKR